MDTKQTKDKTHLPHSLIIREDAMIVLTMFPKVLITMRALSAVTALPSPNTAVKNRLAVSTLDVRIASFGTGHPKLERLTVLSARS